MFPERFIIWSFKNCIGSRLQCCVEVEDEPGRVPGPGAAGLEGEPEAAVPPGAVEDGTQSTLTGPAQVNQLHSYNISHFASKWVKIAKL